MLALWGLCGAYIIHGPLGFTRPVALPTEVDSFRPVAGRVDAGAGSGRSTVMVLLSRPAAKSSRSIDLLATTGSPTTHRIASEPIHGRQELKIGSRSKVGDMREMPFDDASFDGVVSVAAIDHLNREGVERTLAEVTRVLRPEGQFLLMVVNPDILTKVAMPFLHGHGLLRRARVSGALAVATLGRRPGSRGGRDPAGVALFLAQKTGQARYGSAKTYTAPPSGTSGY